MTETDPQIGRLVIYDPDKHRSTVEGLAPGFYVAIVGIVNGVIEVSPFWEPEAHHIAGISQKPKRE